MTDLWELICHHTYRGVPGCIVDLSPSGASHGQAVGLPDADFLTDGAAPGAINFHDPASHVLVRGAAEPWRRPLEGIKGEVTLRREAEGARWDVVSSDGFGLF